MRPHARKNPRLGVRLLLTVILGGLVGCAGLSGKALEDLEAARKLAKNDPSACIQRLDSVLEEDPDNLEARRLQAQSLEALNRPEEAVGAWARIIHSPAEMSRSERARAHRHHGRLILGLLGTLPPPGTAPTSAREKQIRSADASFEYLLSRDEKDREALLGRAQCLTRLGQPRAAFGFADRLLSLSPEDRAANYVHTRLREVVEGWSPQLLNMYVRLMRAQDDALRWEVAEHVLWLVESSRLPEADRRTAADVLVRLSRGEGGFPQLQAWVTRHLQQEVEARQGEAVEAGLVRVDDALRRADYDRAWNILESLPDSPGVLAKRTQVSQSWTRYLLKKGHDLLDARQLDEARELVDVFDRMPHELLTPELLSGREKILARLERLEEFRVAKKRIQRAEDAMRRRQPEEALSHLEGLEDLTEGEVRSSVLVLRARALLETGDNTGALEAFDEAEHIALVPDKRSYGLLLVEAGRADEATPFLDLMPIGAMRGEVLDALIASLERQGNWENILSRLSDLDPLPQRFLPVRRRAALAAAERYFRLDNPERGLGHLNTYLNRDELLRPPVLSTYVLGLVRTKKLDEVRDVVLGTDPRHLSSLPSDLMLELVDKLGDRIETDDRFRLLKIAERSGAPEEIASRLTDLAPRLGSYLPAPGNHALRFRTTNYDDGEAEATVLTNITLKWKDDHFEAEGDDLPREKWWIADGRWHRKSGKAEALIPVLVDDDDRLPMESYEVDNVLWIAEVVASGTTVVVGDSTYRGCLRIKLVPNENEDDAVFIEVAPEIGEIRRETYENGEMTRVRELVRFTSS